MNRTRSLAVSLLVVIVGAVVLVFAAGGSAHRSPSSSATISVRQTSLGNVLVGAGGRTLYLFVADKPGVSTLSQAGFTVWPALLAAGSAKAGSGASASSIGTINTLGKRQLTYAGHPLYYFAGDRQAGGTAGQGLFEFGAKWYALSPSGTPVTKAPVTPAPAISESGSGESGGGAGGY
ncbi:MAG TPA: hypothetical protein VGN08_01965 [Solirubrobacteraceae bacterium]|jgi:predicted lipoprotein with Yx(FWY)xxD motif